MERLRWRAQYWYTAAEIAELGDDWSRLVAWHAQNAARGAMLHGATTGEGLQPGETFRFVLRLDMHALTPEDVEYLAICEAADRERAEAVEAQCVTCEVTQYGADPFGARCAEHGPKD